MVVNWQVSVLNVDIYVLIVKEFVSGRNDVHELSERPIEFSSMIPALVEFGMSDTMKKERNYHEACR